LTNCFSSLYNCLYSRRIATLWGKNRSFF